MKRAKVHTFEIEELAAYMTGLNYDSLEGDIIGQVEQELFSEYEITLDQLQQVVEVLLPMIDVADSSLTNTKFKGFSKREGNVGTWILKTEI